jgi:hypothetical protein
VISQNNFSPGDNRQEIHITSNDQTAAILTQLSAGYVFEIMALAYRPTNPAYRLQIVQAVVWLNGETPSISTLKDDTITHSGSDIDITISLSTDARTLSVNVLNCSGGDMTVVFKPIFKIPVNLRS